MGWLVEERDQLARASQKALGMLSGVATLLRTAQDDPRRPLFNDADVANMLELIRDTLLGEIPGWTLPTNPEVGPVRR